MKTNFNDFLNENDEWLTKYKLQSDNIRFYYIQKALNSEPSNEKVIINKLTDTWDGYDDLVFVKNRNSHIDYYEGFVQSCWDALYQKEEYKNLSKDDAVEKLVSERMSLIGKDLDLIIDDYYFKNSILYIKYLQL